MKTLRRPGQQQPNHVLCIVTDGHSTICHTEATLDTWWANLSPEEKAEAYELHLEPAAVDPWTPCTPITGLITALTPTQH